MPLWRTPWRDGMRPVSRVARFGMQIGEATKKRSAAQPAAASASMCGVRTTWLP